VADRKSRSKSQPWSVRKVKLDRTAQKHGFTDWNAYRRAVNFRDPSGKLHSIFKDERIRALYRDYDWQRIKDRPGAVTADAGKDRSAEAINEFRQEVLEPYRKLWKEKEYGQYSAMPEGKVKAELKKILIKTGRPTEGWTGPQSPDGTVNPFF